MHKTAEAITMVREGLASIPPVDAGCHVGICAQSECAYCQRIIAAHNALTSLDPHALLGYPEARSVLSRRIGVYQISLYGCANSVLVAQADTVADAKSHAIRALLDALRGVLNMTVEDLE